MSQWKFFFILASSKLTAVNIYWKDDFGSSFGSRASNNFGSTGSGSDSGFATLNWTNRLALAFAQMFVFKTLIAPASQEVNCACPPLMKADMLTILFKLNYDTPLRMITLYNSFKTLNKLIATKFFIILPFLTVVYCKCITLLYVWTAEKSFFGSIKSIREEHNKKIT